MTHPVQVPPTMALPCGSGAVPRTISREPHDKMDELILNKKVFLLSE